MHTVKFLPAHRKVTVPPGTSLLEAAQRAGLGIDTICGGEGICGRCRMIIQEGNIPNRVSWPFTESQMKDGWVLACLSYVYGDLVVKLPNRRQDQTKKVPSSLNLNQGEKASREDLNYKTLPVIIKIYVEFDRPTIFSGQADHQLVSQCVKERLNIPTMQMGLKIITILPRILRSSGYKVTLTVGLRRDIAEIMNIEAGSTEASNYMAIVDMGTTTVVAHLVNATPRTTVDSAACYNSQSIHGAEVTGRMIHAERKGIKTLQQLLVNDINGLIELLCERNRISQGDVTAVVCAGNTAMEHFLLGLPTANIRRKPFIPVTVAPPPIRASEVGLKVNSRGLLYSLPGISGWVGSDLTAGILTLQMHRRKELSLLIDIGTNGEVILGNREWLIAVSASAGPALEGASVECGMRAEPGAVDRVWVESGKIEYTTIEGRSPVGICGSGIIDLVSVLLNEKIINRSGIFIDENRTLGSEGTHRRRFVLIESDNRDDEGVYLTEKDIENIITAKAAIFAAINILMRRVSLKFSDIDSVYIAGAFGNYLNTDSAVNIGLLPPLEGGKIHYVGNTSIRGAKLAAFYQEAFYELSEICDTTTYYDLLGADDYVEEFKKALFLPHTDINYWRGII